MLKLAAQRLRAGLWTICALALLAPSATRAQAPALIAVAGEPAASALDASEQGLPASYTRAIDAAVDEHERGHFAEAREHFRAAHDVFPNARTLRGLGKTEFELRNYGEAVKFLTAALASTVRPLTPPLRHEVEHVLERARAYVGEVHVDVQPGSASVSVDGVTVASGPQAALALQVGEHVLEFRATGRLSERRQVTVRGRDQINIQVVLTPPEPERTALPNANQERPPYSAPSYRKWWVWATAGVVAAGAVTAIVLASRDPDTRDAPDANWTVHTP